MSDYRRVRAILKRYLNATNKIEITFGFNIINWSISEINKVSHIASHAPPKSDIDRLYVSGGEITRGHYFNAYQ